MTVVALSMHDTANVILAALLIVLVLFDVFGSVYGVCYGKNKNENRILWRPGQT